MGRNRALDMEIALRVTKLPGVGWYKRQSCRDTINVVASGPDDFTEDHPQWKAGRSYLWQGEVGEDGVVQGRIHTIPNYTSDANEAMKVRDRIVSMGLGIPFAKRLQEEHGSWLTCSAEDLCKAALGVVVEKEAQKKAPKEGWWDGWWDEPHARRVAFDVDKTRVPHTTPLVMRELLEGAIVALDIARQKQVKAERERDGLRSIVKSVDKVISEELLGALVLDHRRMRIRALARQRNVLRDLVRGIYARLSPYQDPGYARKFETSWMAKGVGGTLRDIEEAKVMSSEYDSAPKEG